MIIDLEKLKKARTAVGITWTTMSPDNAMAQEMGWLSDLLLRVIDDIEFYKVCMLQEGVSHEP